ncbi:hypothetical protein H8K33_05600 [Undibacterium amnicola]|uniref:LysR family transcriptional regulator n=1 Tax=Undibacterium amnicola TaxID=1834038 RepID=A0ABR6XNW0_9BURK|nr:hypothetical protein [Undibacterium amnicola]MBC3830973.1 hypothetical protein [Undibacterium amnicola]
MTLSVGHYLKIYQTRKAMMDSGVISPTAIGRELISRLSSRLAELDPVLPCEVSRLTDSVAVCTTRLL